MIETLASQSKCHVFELCLYSIVSIICRNKNLIYKNKPRTVCTWLCHVMVTLLHDSNESLNCLGLDKHILKNGWKKVFEIINPENGSYFIKRTSRRIRTVYNACILNLVSECRFVFWEQQVSLVDRGGNVHIVLRGWSGSFTSKYEITTNKNVYTYNSVS